MSSEQHDPHQYGMINLGDEEVGNGSSAGGAEPSIEAEDMLFATDSAFEEEAEPKRVFVTDTGPEFRDAEAEAEAKAKRAKRTTVAARPSLLGSPKVPKPAEPEAPASREVRQPPWLQPAAVRRPSPSVVRRSEDPVEPVALKVRGPKHSHPRGLVGPLLLAFAFLGGGVAGGAYLYTQMDSEILALGACVIGLVGSMFGFLLARGQH